MRAVRQVVRSGADVLTHARHVDHTMSVDLTVAILCGTGIAGSMPSGVMGQDFAIQYIRVGSSFHYTMRAATLLAAFALCFQGRLREGRPAGDWGDLCLR